MTEIYIVTAFQTIDQVQVNDFTVPNFGDIRRLGWFDNLDEAIVNVENNLGDIYQDSYNYVIIEKLESGIKMVTSDAYLFRWHDGKYKPMRIPQFLYRYSNFGLG